MNRRRFEDRVIIITGGGSGLGQDCCRGFACEGGTVVCADVNVEAATVTSKAVEALGARAIAIRCDVTKTCDVEDMVRDVVRTCGAIDILVNNAGVINRSSLLGTSDEAWQREIDVDLKGPFLCTRAVVPYMIERRYGKIVNISSAAGIVGSVSTAYTAAKAGLDGLTRVWALELAAHGIRVNSVAPAATRTPLNDKLRRTSAARQIGELIPLGWGKPADITAAVLFLSASESDHITGQTLAVDGGLTTTRNMGTEFYRAFDN